MSYLGLVEQKTNELLTIQAFLNSKVTAQSAVLSCLPYIPVVYKVLYFLPLLTGSGKGLQSERACQIPFGSKSRTTSAGY